ncbi:hypothetical protein WJX73_000030 [Symbiochloris irregularis]|uniref:ceramide glucosyltransferase n=1 Tax=Symbiochloris irregularis TaxID=706552 RepID=A0AAW1P7K5_9CHLO
MPPPFNVALQTAVDHLVILLEQWSLLFCHPLVAFVQLQGAIVGLLLAGGWLWAGVMRSREARKQCRRRHQRLSKPYSCSQQQRFGPPGGQAAAISGAFPGVTVVLPVKGCRAHSRRTWRSQLTMLYGGSVEFLFVVDSKGDPACAAVQALALQLSQHMAGGARVIVAPPATTHSQKIGSLITGIQAAGRDSKYVLCLDDDATMHPHSLQMLVQALEADDSAFMATGYPLDIPPAGSSLLTYCALAYHLPLLIAFSIRQATSFVWGGCMLLPLAALKSDAHVILQAWRNGGYSDDLTVAAVCSQQQLKILCPSFAIFPQWLDADMPWRRYWNYLRRQLYVMDTYTSPHNRALNHTMMALHTYLSLAFVIPTVTVALRVGIWGVQVGLLPTQTVWNGPGTSLRWVHVFAAGTCPLSTLSLTLFLAAFALAGTALLWMVAVSCALFRELSPDAQPPYTAEMFNWAKVWAAFFVSNTILPFCMVYTACASSIDWSGHLQRSLNLTLHAVRWIPKSARLVALGEYPRTTGALQVYELQERELKLIHEAELPTAIKCGAFGTTTFASRALVTGNFLGQVSWWDADRLQEPLLQFQAHAGIVNCLDCCGGQPGEAGPPEVATGGRDGCVRVWDARQQDAPVVAFEPDSGSQVRECWSVAFGNAHEQDERSVLAGFDNGDVKLLDLRMGKQRWTTNLRNGVCSVAFDRRGIKENKFVAACLESRFHVFDARTQHPEQGFASVESTVAQGATLWGAAHSPHNRELFMVSAGDGSLHLFKYNYPDQRSEKAGDGSIRGVAGTVEELAEASFSSQPICAFDWSPDRLGLFCCAALDQCLRVGITTRLQNL